MVEFKTVYCFRPCVWYLFSLSLSLSPFGGCAQHVVYISTMRIEETQTFFCFGRAVERTHNRLFLHAPTMWLVEGKTCFCILVRWLRQANVLFVVLSLSAMMLRETKRCFSISQVAGGNRTLLSLSHPGGWEKNLCLSGGCENKTRCSFISQVV